MGNACRCGLRGRRVRALDPDALGIVEKVFNKMAPDQKAGGTIGNLTSNFTTATIRTTVEVRSFLETARKFMGDATEIDVDVLVYHSRHRYSSANATHAILRSSICSLLKLPGCPDRSLISRRMRMGMIPRNSSVR